MLSLSHAHPTIRHSQMDGMELATGVLVLAATNRPSAIDDALMRPGRLDVQLYVPPPDAAGRLEVLRVHTAGMPLSEDVDLEALAGDTENFSGGWLARVLSLGQRQRWWSPAPSTDTLGMRRARTHTHAHAHAHTHLQVLSCRACATRPRSPRCARTWRARRAWRTGTSGR
jgi:hypothetical protein